MLFTRSKRQSWNTVLPENVSYSEKDSPRIQFFWDEILLKGNKEAQTGKIKRKLISLNTRKGIILA